MSIDVQEMLTKGKNDRRGKEACKRALMPVIDNLLHQGLPVGTIVSALAELSVNTLDLSLRSNPVNDD